jgi:hypothetical protein
VTGMTLVENLKETIEQITNKKNITNKESQSVKDQLEEIIPKLNNADKKHIEKIIDTTASGKLLEERKREIQ